MRPARPVERVERALEKWAELRGVRRGGAADERGHDVVRPRTDADANAESFIDRVGRFLRSFERCGQIRRPADRCMMDACAVDGELELVRVLDAPHVVEIGPEQPGLEDVLAVTREEVIDARAANRPKGHAVEMLILRDVAAHVIRLTEHAHLGIAERQLADLFGRRKIAFLQRRRHVQSIGDVVEAVGGIVRGQKGRDIDVHRQKIADGVAVFRAIQPAKQWPPWIGTGRPRAIEFGFDRRDERVSGACIGPSRASRRHQASAYFPNDLLPDLGRASDVIDADAIEG